jgi:acetoin utilization deacetylase AcuC-like enzyme
LKIVYSDAHRKHDPQQFMVRGKLKRSNEQPERAFRLLSAAKTAGHEIILTEEFGAEPRAQVHTPQYLRFLETAYARWQTLDDPSGEVMPNIHPFFGQPCTYPTGVVGQAGYHMADIACSIGAHTWDAAVASAHSATHAARLVMGGERVAYALCRPPGHHAYADRAAGFCYLNNVAIAAQQMRAMYERIAIIDIDVHHGNGTQGIFYRRSDVLTVSLHADPSAFYPFFTGFAYEQGEGDGLGYNLNTPLPIGSTLKSYLPPFSAALDVVRAYRPGALVVALGLDAHEGDPYHGLGLRTEDFAVLLAAIAKLDRPTVLIQEGGYLSEHLGSNLVSALQGFASAA